MKSNKSIWEEIIGNDGEPFTIHTDNIDKIFQDAIDTIQRMNEEEDNAYRAQMGIKKKLKSVTIAGKEYLIEEGMEVENQLFLPSPTHYAKGQ